MGHSLAHLDISLLEKVIRTVAVYAGLAVLLRLAGKRELAQLNSFDLVVMLLLSNVVQNAVIGPDDSLVGGLFGAAVLVAVNATVVRASSANATVAHLFEGTETVVVEDGQYDDRALLREGLRRADLDAALKRQGAGDVSQVQEATLGTGGAVVVNLKPESASATKADVAAVVAALNRLEQQISRGRGR
jgi:uncharacterized membrane protein YcaP (DUF421 family)